jgi:tetratricopeptide (TPR) repeat protein
LINSGGGYPDFAILLLARCLQAFVSDRLEALILSEEVGDHRAQVGTLVGLAQLESDAGDLAAAGAYAERALEICRSFDHPDFLVMAGSVLLHFREIDRAQELVEEALTVARRIEEASERSGALQTIRVVQVALAECRGELNAALRLQPTTAGSRLYGRYLLPLSVPLTPSAVRVVRARYFGIGVPPVARNCAGVSPTLPVRRYSVLAPVGGLTARPVGYEARFE